MADQDAFLHLARPLPPAAAGAQPTTAPLRVVIQPQVSYKGNAPHDPPTNLGPGPLLNP